MTVVRPMPPRTQSRSLDPAVGVRASRRAASSRRPASARAAVQPASSSRPRVFSRSSSANSRPAASLALYLGIGAPGMADQAYETRVRDWASSPETLEPAQAAAVIGRIVKDRPDDHQALVMLGAARFEAGDPIGAASAFRRALAIKPDDAQSWARLGESLVRANEGAVGGDAEAAFVEALKRDPDQLGARYFLGEAALKRGDKAGAAAVWGPLIAALEPNDPRRAELQQRLGGAG